MFPLANYTHIKRCIFYIITVMVTMQTVMSTDAACRYKMKKEDTKTQQTYDLKPSI